MHQGTALVCRKLCTAAGLEPQHILQKVTVAAGIVFFQLAGRDVQPPAQQRFQRGQILHLPGRVLLHALQQRKPTGCLHPLAGGAQRLGQAGTFPLGQRPAAAQHIQPICGGGGKVDEFQLRCGGLQRLHDGLQRGAQGLPLPLRPAHPQPLCRGGKGFIKTDLFPHHAVLKAVRQVDLFCHQQIAVGVGQQAALCGGTGKFTLCQPQHEHIVRRIQTHFTGACQHHRVQGLRDVPKVRGAQQQTEKILVLRHGDALTAQQPRHLVQQLHHHVPLAGGFLCRRDAPGGADILHLRGLLSLCAQFLQAEIQRPADLLGVGAAHLAAQSIHRRHQLFAGVFGTGQVQRIFLGQLGVTEAPGAFGKFCPPRRSIGRPRVGVVFQRTDFRLGQVAQAGLCQYGQLLGHVRAPQQCQQRPHRRGGCAELRGGGLVAVQRDLCHAELVPHRSPVQADIAADHRDLSAAHPLPHQAADGGSGAAGFLLPAGGGKQPQLRGAFRRGAAAGLQQLSQRVKARSVFVAQVPPQQLRRSHLCAVFARQLAQLRRHLLCTGEQFQVPGLHGCAVLAQRHRHGGQRG